MRFNALALIVLGAACGPAAAPTTAPTPAASTPAVSLPPIPPPADSDEAFWADRADVMRRRILSRAEFTEFGVDACNPGSFRTFSRDTSAKSAAGLQSDVDRLERLIIARSIDTPMDSPDAQELMRIVIRWEAAAARPIWDVMPGDSLKQAIAAGLSGEFRNPATGKCESYVPFDTFTVVIPPVTSFVPPKMTGVRLAVLAGDEGLKRARDAFYAASKPGANAVFIYTRLRAVNVWRDYAVVAVNRPAEENGVRQLNKGAGGASYIFHRVGNQWRLLVIARTWG